ncbi:hypothetical protein ACFWP0_23595 [Achromobacter sp. NPDC058515]|uniref:hypothetical protein n=1 Tax=Achromobacter sp. NPDC058515 TaxID=3346533 RepID=UPI00365F2DA3
MDLHRWYTGWVHIIGLVIAAFGGYAAQAFILNIRPFEEPPYPQGWLDDRDLVVKDKQENSDKE